MDELLKKLLEAEVLSEDTQKELKEAFKTHLEQVTNEARQKVEADVRAELTEEWIKERDSLVEAIDTKLSEWLEAEITELKADIDRFRDLEAEHAEKIVEAKAEMTNQLKGDLKELVEKIDAFLEIRLTAEMEELKEDIDVIRKNEFGRRVFEAFQKEFSTTYADEQSAKNSLREVETRLAETEEQLEATERKRAELERTIKMAEVLKPLAGRQREVMEAILRHVETNKLNDGYKTFIGRVLKEAEADSGKEDKVLAEGADEDKDDDKKKEDKKDDDKKDKDDDKSDKKDKKSDKKDKDSDVKEGVRVTGDSEEVIKESEDPEKAARIARLKRIAGI